MNCTALLTLLPATVFWGVYRARGGEKAPVHISSYRAHTDKIPTAIAMFPGSSFLVVVLPISWDVDVCQKSKMAAKLLEEQITLLVLQIHMSFQKQYRGL